MRIRRGGDGAGSRGRRSAERWAQAASRATGRLRPGPAGRSAGSDRERKPADFGRAAGGRAATPARLTNSSVTKDDVGRSGCRGGFPPPSRGRARRSGDSSPRVGWSPTTRRRSGGSSSGGNAPSRSSGCGSCTQFSASWLRDVGSSGRSGTSSRRRGRGALSGRSRQRGAEAGRGGRSAEPARTGEGARGGGGFGFGGFGFRAQAAALAGEQLVQRRGRECVLLRVAVAPAPRTLR